MTPSIAHKCTVQKKGRVVPDTNPFALDTTVTAVAGALVIAKLMTKALPVAGDGGELGHEDVLPFATP